MFGLYIFRESEYEEWPHWVLVQSKDGRLVRRQLKRWPVA